MKTVIGILVVYFLAGPSASFAFDLYIKSMQAPVYASPTVQSDKLAELKKGEKVAGVEEKGSWYRISFGDKEGWVFKYLAGKQPPVQATSIYGKYNSLSQKYKAFSDKARRRPSSYAAAAAARGLREKRERFGESHSLNYEALNKIEAIEITEEQARTFLEKGIKDDQTN